MNDDAPIASALTDFPTLFSPTWFGTVDNTDLANPTRLNTFRQDFVLLDIRPNDVIQVSLDSESQGDPYLQLINADTGAVIDFDNDDGPGQNARLHFTAQAGVNYILRATTFQANVAEQFTIDVSLSPEVPRDTGGDVAIPMPADDPALIPGNIISLRESEFTPGTGTGPNNPRRIPNEITAFVDGSNIYGSDLERQTELRSFNGGQLKVSEGICYQSCLPMRIFLTITQVHRDDRCLLPGMREPMKMLP